MKYKGGPCTLAQSRGQEWPWDFVIIKYVVFAASHPRPESYVSIPVRMAQGAPIGKVAKLKFPSFKLPFPAFTFRFPEIRLPQPQFSGGRWRNELPGPLLDPRGRWGDRASPISHQGERAESSYRERSPIRGDYPPVANLAAPRRASPEGRDPPRRIPFFLGQRALPFRIPHPKPNQVILAPGLMGGP